MRAPGPSRSRARPRIGADSSASDRGRSFFSIYGFQESTLRRTLTGGAGFQSPLTACLAAPWSPDARINRWPAAKAPSLPGPCAGLPRPAPAAAVGADPAWPQPRHGIAMHGEPALPPGFRRPPLCQPGRAQGRPHRLRRSGHLRQPESASWSAASRPDVAPRDGLQGLMVRSFDEPFSLYGLVARPSRRRTIAAGCSSTSIRGRRFSDGLPADRGGRPVHLRPAQGRRESRIHAELRAGRQGRGAATGPCPFDLAGADDRELPLIIGADADLRPPRHRIRRPSNRPTSQPAGRLGPLRGRRGEARRARHLIGGPGFLGQGPAHPRGLYNADEIRFDYLPRRQQPVRGLQGRPLRCPARTSPSAGSAAMISPPSATAAWCKDPCRCARPRA